MEKPTFGISIDGSCLNNPGPGEYRAINIETGETMFEHKFSHVTNNIMEFFALVHALKYVKENKSNERIYTDSQTAIAWVKNGNVNTGLERSKKTEKVYEHIQNCLVWLANNTKEQFLESTIVKWDTKTWGECPADYGRKQYSKNEDSIPKSELIKFLEEYSAMPLADITVIGLIKKRFNI